MALLNAKDLESKIAQIGKTAGELQSEIQIAAVNAIGHSIENGDIRFGQKLFDVLPSGVRRASLVAFLEKHGNFAYLKDEKKFAYYKAQTSYDEVALLATSWASAKSENIVSEYDVQDMFDKLMKRIESAIKKSGDGSVKVLNTPLYDYLQEAQDRFNAEREFVKAA
jgi:hypothetical protein